MKVMIIIIGIVAFLISLLWVAGFLFVNDFSVSGITLDKYHKILLIFPHADDEILGSAGLIQQANKEGKEVTLVILTKGEKGTPNGMKDLRLKEIRMNEAESVSKFLGVTELIQEDFGDGELINKKSELTSYVSNLIITEKPDLVITYDESGLYGHPDHIIVSEIVTKLIKEKNLNTSLWYTTYPKRVLSMAKLPEQMAKDTNFKEKRNAPTTRLFIGTGFVNKIRSTYMYKSQYQSFRNGIPFNLPLWFVYSMGLYEYFYQVN